jgi:hypothetical protein
MAVIETFMLGMLLGGAVGALVAKLLLRAALWEGKYREERAYNDGRQAALSEIRVERIPLNTRQGIVFKKRFFVLQERLTLHGLPICPFHEHKFLVAEELDEKELKAVSEAFAAVAANILSVADVRGMVLNVLGDLSKARSPSNSRSKRKPRISGAA